MLAELDNSGEANLNFPGKVGVQYKFAPVTSLSILDLLCSPASKTDVS